MHRTLISWTVLTILSIAPALAASQLPPTTSATATVTNLLKQETTASTHSTSAPKVPSAPRKTALPASAGHKVPFVFQTLPVTHTVEPPTMKSRNLERPPVQGMTRTVQVSAHDKSAAHLVAHTMPGAATRKNRPRPVVAIDPFKGRPLGYERLLNTFRAAQIRAKIAQQRYNRMRFEKQINEMGGVPGASAPPETAKLRRLQKSVAVLQNSDQQLTNQLRTRAAATATRHRRGALHLIAVMRGNNRRSAILQYGHVTRTVHAGDVVGHFWVRAIHRHSIALAGPHRVHVLTMKDAVGVVAPESQASAGQQVGAKPVSDTNNPLMALNARLAQMAHQPSLPPP